MKKSIFLFFAAILCAMSANAYTVYLNTGTIDWATADAKFMVWTGSENVEATKIGNKWYSFEVGDATGTMYFKRCDPNSGDTWNEFNASISSTNNLVLLTDWTAGESSSSLHVTGDDWGGIGSWNIENEAGKMTLEGNVFTKTFTNVSASAHQFKLTFNVDSDWSHAIGYDQNKCSGTNCTVENGGGNIQFTPLAEGTVTITYTLADGKVHITCPEPPAAEFNITYPATQTNYTLVAGPAKAQTGAEVSFTATPAEGYVLNVTYNGNVIAGENNVYTFMMPASDVTIAITAVAATTLYYVDHNDWGNVNAYMWSDNGNNGSWPGAAMALVGTVGDNAYSYYSISFAQGAYASIIFNGGGSQTADLTINTAKPYFYDGEWYTWDDLLVKLATPVVTYDYYIVGSFNGDNPKKEENGMTLDGTVYKATVTLATGDNTLKVTDGTWDNTWGYGELGAAYEEVSDAGAYNNIKITLAAEKEITVIFDATAGKITFENLTEKAPAEDVTVYFINSGEWAEVACHYWGGIEGSTWPGEKMTANGEVFEAEGWEVYAITFPGDNTSCIFNDNKAEGATQTGNLEVQNGKYYCYENGIWYERLADVDPLDTRVYLKGQMNEWCAAGYCDMFRKEDMSETVAYRTTWLDANTTYEFKIESAGAWLSNTSEMTKDNCTDWTFEADKDNCKITTEYAGDYTFIWDMTTNQLSVEYPNPMANPTVLDLMVTNMEFDGEKTFSGSNNMYGNGIAFNLVVGDMIDEGVFALDASSTVDVGGTPFTDVTGTITPDMSMGMPTAATAVVYGFLDGMYFQLNVEMSAGGGTLVEIWDGVATLNDATGELTISANWEGETVTITVPGFDYISYECDEIWFETESVVAFGPATITVEDGGVLVEGSVISGATGAQYELMVFGLLPVEETPDYTRTVTAGNFGTLCLPFGGEITGAVLYECVGSETGKLYLGSVTTLEAGVPYIFQATATELAVYSDGTTAPAGNHNGLYGTFDNETVVAAGYYILYNNEFRPSDGEAMINANRAYLVMSEIPSGAPQQMPGRRYISMDVQGENVETSVEDIFTTDAPAKVIENGQLIIIREGVKYNVQGQKL